MLLVNVKSHTHQTENRPDTTAYEKLFKMVIYCRGELSKNRNRMKSADSTLLTRATNITTQKSNTHFTLTRHSHEKSALSF